MGKSTMVKLKRSGTIMRLEYEAPPSTSDEVDCTSIRNEIRRIFGRIVSSA